MDHIVVPLGSDHLRAFDLLAATTADAAGFRYAPGARVAHMTLLAYTGAGRPAVCRVVERATAGVLPFVLHAHGYGFFTGDEPTDLSLHVPVVRTAALDALHRRLWADLERAGASIANWCTPDLWSPHITLIDRVLDPVRLGAAVAWLARRHHPSWRIPVDRVLVTGGWPEHDRPGDVVLLGVRPAPA